MPNLKSEIGVVVNDLGIYFNGLEVALGHDNIKDVVRYLNNMKEVSYALATLQPIEQIEQSLEELFGDGAELIMRAIADRELKH